MGFPFFTWLPHQTTEVSPYRETITLSEDLTDMQITPRRDTFESYSIFGGRSRENLRAWMDVRITLDRFNDRNLFLKFRNLIDHLERGGSVAFGNDSAKCYSAAMRKVCRQRNIGVDLGRNLHKSRHADAPDQLAVGDEIVLESFPPKAGREYHTIKSVSGSTLETFYNFGPSGAEVLAQDDYAINSRVRHADYFPTLILPSSEVGSLMLTHDRRITFTLDLNLTYVLPARTLPEDVQQNTAGSEKPDGTDMG
jgi:hypothetical protein